MSATAERSDCPSGVAHGTMEAVQLLLVDAFTSSPFTGNPAGVCLTDADDAAWMQAVAAEVNVSETAFVDLSSLATTGEVGLRWFTPTVEVEICGHATLASAHVLFEQGLAESPIAFRTASGVLRAEALPGGGIQLDFPVDVPISALPDSHLADEFADALGAAIVEIARCRYDVLVEIPSAAEVRDLEPDLSVLRAASGRGVIVTARAEEDPTPGRPRLRLPVLRPRGGDRRGPGDRARRTAASRRTGRRGSGGTAWSAPSSPRAAARSASSSRASASTCAATRSPSAVASCSPRRRRF